MTYPIKNNCIEYPVLKQHKLDRRTVRSMDRLERLKDIIRQNLQTLQTFDGQNMFLTFSPLYYNGNDDVVKGGVVVGYVRGALQRLYDDMNAPEFLGTFLMGDLPTILENTEVMFQVGIPVNIAIPFANRVVTLIIVKVGPQWIIINIFINEESVYSRGLKSALELAGSTVKEAFDMQTIKEDEK